MKILIIEDEHELLATMKNYLESEGFLCETAISYFEAEDLLSAYNYDMIVLDLTLPGGSTTVSTVKVENLTQSKSLEMNGSDVLHLLGVVTGIETVRDGETGKIRFYPNPMNDYARMQFDLPESGRDFNYPL